MDLIRIVRRNHQRSPFEGGLPDQSLSQSNFPGFAWIRERVAADADQAGAGLVRDIECTVEERNTLRNPGKQAGGKASKIFGGLEAHSGGRGLGLDPRQRLTITGAFLKGLQRAANLADFVRLFQVRNRLIEMTAGYSLDAVPQGPELLNHPDMNDVRGQGKGGQ